MTPKPIAYLLPQYHPIPENDEWWGKGFTEWTNVAKAKPLFKGHHQPRLPADLGFYDLRLPEVREQQAELAREHGIHGFCYYHYWFGNGKQLLERPFNEVLTSGKPDFPFMLCWANETWKGVWFGASKGKVLIEQTYPGAFDYLNHFNSLLSAFNDPRYIRFDDKPVFYVYKPLNIPELKIFVDVFREASRNNGFKDIYLLAGNCPSSWDPQKNGFDGMVSNNFHEFWHYAKSYFVKNGSTFSGRVERKVRNLFSPKIFDDREKPYYISYQHLINIISNWPAVAFDYFPEIVPDWDNSARSGVKSLVLKDSTPELWQLLVDKACSYSTINNPDHPYVFIKSWNEWAEGNYLEPDDKWGLQYLNSMKDVLQRYY